MQVTYFPYLNMGTCSEATLHSLDLKVWNYGKKADDYINDLELRTTLDSLMATNIAHRQVINDMGIVLIGEFDCRPFSLEEKTRCEEARLLLFVASLAYSGVLERGANTGHFIATTENFTLVEQNFEKGGERIAIRDGYVVSKLIGGYKIDEVKFGRPDYTPTPMKFTGDEALLKNLSVLKKSQKRLYRRLLRSIDMFMQAYYNDTKLSMQSRVLLIASSYEILFDLPDRQQRKELKEIFKNIFVDPEDPKKRYSSERQTAKGFEWEVESIKVMWVDKFYTLRNKIIHGSSLRPDDYIFLSKQRHFDIAALFFVLGLKKAISNTPQVEETSDQVIWEKHEDLDGEESYEGFVYKKNDGWASVMKKLLRESKNAKD